MRRNLLFVIGVLILIALAALLIPAQAHAWDGCELWGTCRAKPSYRERQIERERAAYERRIQRERDVREWERCVSWGRRHCGHRPYTAVYDYQRRDGIIARPQCVQMVTAKGGAANTETGALNQAKRAWRAAVRSDFGEIYIELLNAKDITYRCWRASTNESVLGSGTERLVGALGFEGYQKRCQVWSRPCLGDRIPLKIEEKDERD